MECLIWEWTQKCTDIPNLHALMWEIFVGIGIALGIWRMQSKKANARKIHDEETIINLLGNLRYTVRRFADDIIYFQKEKATEEQESEMQKQYQITLKHYEEDIQDIINTSFDVVDSSIVDNLRTLKILLKKPMFGTKINFGQLLSIDNHLIFILYYQLDKRRHEVIKNKKKWYENQFKLMSNVPKEQMDVMRESAQLEIKKISFIKNDPDELIKKIPKNMEKKPSFVDSRGQMYFD